MKENSHECEGFITSSMTGTKTGVAVRINNGGAEVRDSKDEFSPTLSFTKIEWVAFIQGVRKNEFDISS